MNERLYFLIDPSIKVFQVGRVNGKTFNEHFTLTRCLICKLLKVRPRRLGINEVRRYGRHTTPIVDSRRYDSVENTRTQIRRRLNIHFRPEYQPSYRNRPKEFVQIRFRRINHLGAGLSTKVLNNEFLKLPLLAACLAERE